MIHLGENSIPFVFEISPDPEKWTNLSSLRLHGRVKVFNTTTNAAPAETENWSVINNFYQSLFSKVIVKINGTEISDPSSNPYPYKSYIETLLNYSNDFKEKILTASHWFEDPPNKTARVLEKKKSDGSENALFNPAYVERRTGIEKGAYNEFNLPIHSDIITATKYLPPNYSLEIILTRMSDNFVILKGDDNANNYKIVLDNIHLSCDRLVVSERVNSAYNNSLRSTIPATIPLTRNLIKAYPKSETATDLGVYNFYMGKVLPEAIYIAFVSQQAYNGDAKQNPFYFQNIELLEASLIVNSYNEPSQPYTNTFESKRKMDLYFDFLRNVGGNMLESQSVPITYDMYYGGYFILAFDRTRNKDNRFRRQRADSGTIDINLKAKSPLSENIVVLVYATYSSSIELMGDDVRTATF